MKYSVIIPALNEADNIANAIKALLAQTVSRSDFEIIVVDNNSTDDTGAVALRAGADVLLHQTQPGTNISRQTGVEKAQGEIIAFLDADSVPPSDWLERIDSDLLDNKYAAVSGPLDYGFTGIRKGLAYLYNKYAMTWTPRALKQIFGQEAGVIIGGNFAARKETLEKIGGLPPLAFWGDDTAIAMLISRQAGPVLFDAKLIIKSSPRRFQRMGFFQLVARYVLAYFKIFFDKKYR